jgi:predicted transcriptional regulator
MTEEEPDQLRDKDRVILQTINEGYDDVQKITAETTLQNHEVNYSLQKLEDLDLVTITKPDGYTERTINGQKRVFQAPKQAELTEQGKQQIRQSPPEDIDQYENLSKKELVEEVYSLESRVNQLERQLKTFKKQVTSQLRD